MIAIEEGNLTQARRHFAESLRIRKEVEPYPKGQADALFGLALCDFIEGKLKSAEKKSQQSLKINPSLLNRGFV